MLETVRYSENRLRVIESAVLKEKESEGVSKAILVQKGLATNSIELFDRTPTGSGIGYVADCHYRSSLSSP